MKSLCKATTAVSVVYPLAKLTLRDIYLQLLILFISERNTVDVQLKTFNMHIIMKSNFLCQCAHTC